MPFHESPIVKAIIGCAIAVHKATGPGLLESPYEHCLAYKFDQAGLRYQRQIALPLIFEEIKLDCGYRADFLVEKSVLLELKSIERLMPIHTAQLITYVKLSDADYGLLINFNVEILKNGIKTVVNPRLLKKHPVGTVDATISQGEPSSPQRSTVPTFPTCKGFDAD